MRAPYLVGLCGPAGVGKSTIATLLADVYAFERLRFAGPLKSMLRELGLTQAQVDGNQKETPCALLCGKTPRQAMQYLGDEWGRQLIGPDIWVHAALNKANKYLAIGRSVVIDDVRYDNEAQEILRQGGVIIRLVRQGFEPSTEHASEEGLSGYLVTYFVSNNQAPRITADDIVFRLRNAS